MHRKLKGLVTMPSNSNKYLEEIRENYVMLVEVINGEASFNNCYKELKSFARMHIDLFQQICVLSKEIVSASIV